MERRVLSVHSAALTLAVSAATVAAIAVTAPASAVQASGQVRHASATNAVAGSYLVVLKPALRAAVAASAQDLAGRYGGHVRKTFGSALHGFTVSMDDRQAQRLAADSRVAFVEQNRHVRISNPAGTSPSPRPRMKAVSSLSWGLDRIDQHALPLDKAYKPAGKAANVTAYVIDTGVRISHQVFGGRASSGFDAVDNDGNADDCNGHGTHVAGTIGGAGYGVAQDVKIVAVRVLDCEGSGTTEQVVAGIDWVTAHAAKPAVVNMSLGGGVDAAIDQAVSNSIKSGITFAVASGNENVDACNSSPARVAEAITVNATGDKDARAEFSNLGKCTDLFAPGVDILSAWITNDTASKTISGTSMATPHVTGAAALVLGANPTASPAEVLQKLVLQATPDVVTDPGTGSPNKLLYVGS